MKHIDIRKEHESFLLRTWRSAKLKQRQELLFYHSRQIEYLQHERLIHLIVTLFIAGALLFVVGLIIFETINCLLVSLFAILSVLTIAYLLHYYKLENTCQRWQNYATEFHKQLLTKK